MVVLVEVVVMLVVLLVLVLVVVFLVLVVMVVVYLTRAAFPRYSSSILPATQEGLGNQEEDGAIVTWKQRWSAKHKIAPTRPPNRFRQSTRIQIELVPFQISDKL